MIKKYIARSCVTLALTGFSFCVSVVAKAETWQENFNGSFNTNWEVEDDITWVGNRTGIQQENLSWDGGGLSLVFKKNNNNWVRLNGNWIQRSHSGAEIRKRRAVGNGWYTARMKAPWGPGLDSGFFLFRNTNFHSSDTGQDFWREIDFEFLGVNTWNIHRNVFSGNPNSPSQQPAKIWVKTGSNNGWEWHNGYHNYQIRYQQDKIYWYIDGNWKAQTNNPFATKTGRLYVYANIWAPFNEGGFTFPDAQPNRFNEAPNQTAVRFDWISGNDWSR